MRVKLCLLLFLNGCIGSQPSVKELIDADIEYGISLLRAEDFSGAQATFEKILNVEPKVQAIDGLGCIAFYRGDYTLAISRFEQAQKIDPSYQTAKLNLAMLYDKIGEIQRAKNLYLTLLSSDQNFRTLNNLAVLSYENGEKLEQTQAMFNQAKSIQQHPVLEENIKVIRRSIR